MGSQEKFPLEHASDEGRGRPADMVHGRCCSIFAVTRSDWYVHVQFPVTAYCVQLDFLRPTWWSDLGLLLSEAF